MTPASFKQSLSQPEPPACSPAMQALWWAAKDDWDAAHAIVMRHDDDKDCAWVHAHLHRVEGDLDNARYWYRRAGKRETAVMLDAEREAIIAALL